LIYTITESYSSNKTVFETGEIAAVNVDGTKHKLIFGYKAGERQLGKRGRAIKAAYGNQKIIDLLPKDHENILIAFYPWKNAGRFWKHNPQAPTVIYKLNVYNGKRIRVDSLPLPDSTAITDNHGHLRFSIGENDANELVVYYRKENSNQWIHFDTDGFEGIDALPKGFTVDNKAVYVTANVGEGTRGLYLFNLESQTFTKLFQDNIVDISNIIYDFSGKNVIAVSTELAKPQYHYIQSNSPKAKYHKMLLRSFKDSDVILTSVTDDRNFIVAYVYSDSNPGDYYLFNTRTKKVHFLLTTKSKIFPESLVNTDAFKVEVRDGSTIYGFLTLPKGKSKQLPLVVLPHGGPYGIRDSWGYDWEVQLLANRGYAVLQVNFRGSGGFGLEYSRAGWGEWGRLMQDDLTDATKAVIERGIADPKRICIFGASYGGYAALMGAVREPDLYQCAIGSAGVYNLPMMFEEGDIPESKSGLAYLKDAIGDDLEDQKRRSPVFNVDKIKANILLIHGAKDRRVPIEQVESLKQAFDEIGKNYQWLELPFEGHGYYDEGNRLLVYNKVLEFLDKTIVHEQLKKHQ